MPTASRVLSSLPIVRGWETFQQSGKVLDVFKKVSHPLIPCGCKDYVKSGKLGNFFYKKILKDIIEFISQKN